MSGAAGRSASALLLAALLLLSWADLGRAMRPAHATRLRRETVDMFYHGFDNYMRIAFPEDELRPVSCAPLTRDAKNPRHVELNDVLGNYSLTLIDSLSTLAILASAPAEDAEVGAKALADFQDGVQALVQQYGDGRPGPSGQGLRSRGFDVDSKVQVFETVIRGVGGLLSAHLFAAGELPISGYSHRPGVAWSNGMAYDGQILRLALDLATRLLPAFYTETGMPYPRVNLRHGIPFYVNSPLHTVRRQTPAGAGAAANAGGGGDDAEITETCSAGAGSLVLEFTVLSRLTGDARFEQLAKRAFWAVWYRRSDIGLIGAGVDAEHGKWIGAFSVVGAGADSFFEYALKTHILLSGQPLPRRSPPDSIGQRLDPNALFPPLTDEENSADAFLEAWHQAHAAIKRHLYTDRGHPHYVNVNLWTGSLATQWIDSLGAYYSGLLTLAGEVDEAVETHLLYAAVWTRYAALPERWSVRDKSVEGGLGWWPLRPEFVESTYHIYRATLDPWYLYVGEMVLRDVTRRCRTECGWAGLQNVVDGQKSDRMESFFLGETTKYLYLLFDHRHPLNSLDAPFVFTTEGHPLIIPREPRSEERPTTGSGAAVHARTARSGSRAKRSTAAVEPYYNEAYAHACPAPPQTVPLTSSIVAARRDLYHPAKMVDLHLVPNMHAEQTSRTAAKGANHSVYPWTLPANLLPPDGICAPVHQPVEVMLEFAPNAQQAVGGGGTPFSSFMAGTPNLDRITVDKIRVLSISALKITMRLEDDGAPKSHREWRVTRVNGLPLGRDESLVIDRAILGEVSDPRFNMVRDPVVVKLHHLHQVELVYNETESDDGAAAAAASAAGSPVTLQHKKLVDGSVPPPAAAPLGAADIKSRVKSFFRQIVNSLDGAMPAATAPPTSAHGARGGSAAAGEGGGGPTPPAYNVLVNVTGVTPTGAGAAPLPAVDMPAGAHIPVAGPFPPGYLPWSTVFAAGDACGGPLPDLAPRDHQVIVIRRGGCSFSTKLANIPAFKPSHSSLHLVVVVSDDGDDDGFFAAFGGGLALPRGLERSIGGDYDRLIRPLLDEPQVTPSGMTRVHPIAMVLVGGGDVGYHHIAHAERLGITRRYYIESQGMRVRNIIIDDGDGDELSRRV